MFDQTSNHQQIGTDWLTEFLLYLCVYTNYKFVNIFMDLMLEALIVISGC